MKPARRGWRGNPVYDDRRAHEAARRGKGLPVRDDAAHRLPDPEVAQREYLTLLAGRMRKAVQDYVNAEARKSEIWAYLLATNAGIEHDASLASDRHPEYIRLGSTQRNSRERVRTLALAILAERALDDIWRVRP